MVHSIFRIAKAKPSLLRHQLDHFENLHLSVNYLSHPMSYTSQWQPQNVFPWSSWHRSYEPMLVLKIPFISLAKSELQLSENRTSIELNHAYHNHSLILPGISCKTNHLRVPYLLCLSCSTIDELLHCIAHKIWADLPQMNRLSSIYRISWCSHHHF